MILQTFLNCSIIEWDIQIFHSCVCVYPDISLDCLDRGIGGGDRAPGVCHQLEESGEVFVNSGGFGGCLTLWLSACIFEESLECPSFIRTGWGTEEAFSHSLSLYLTSHKTPPITQSQLSPHPPHTHHWLRNVPPRLVSLPEECGHGGREI